MHGLVVPIICLLAARLCMADPALPQACPKKGTLEQVENPAAWADRCFAAMNRRLPSLERVGEADSVMRDLDLDGTDERLEIRGVGNAMKQIYVFRRTERGFVYLGELNAHPAFVVAVDADGDVTISYLHRFGADDVEIKRIQYMDNRFVEISSGRTR